MNDSHYSWNTIDRLEFIPRLFQKNVNVHIRPWTERKDSFGKSHVRAFHPFGEVLPQCLHPRPEVLFNEWGIRLVHPKVWGRVGLEVHEFFVDDALLALEDGVEFVNGKTPSPRLSLIDRHEPLFTDSLDHLNMKCPFLVTIHLSCFSTRCGMYS